MKKLKELRKTQNKTQEEMAKELGIKKQNYQNYEIGRRNPNFETLIKIADYFKVSIDFLLEHKTNAINLEEITLLQKEIIKKIINSNELICTKVNAYLEGLLEGQKEQEKVINILTKGK